MADTRDTQSQHDESGLLLAHLLLAVVLLELAIHRLAVPALLPLRETPPSWHVALSWLGSFVFYFSVAFALALLGRQVVRLVARKTLLSPAVAIPLAISSLFLAAMTMVVVLSSGSERVIFALNATFTVSLLVLVVAQLPTGGDLGARIGIVLLALPLILHFYAPFTLRFISGDDIGLPERVQVFGQWSLVFSALATPYCFGPRPFSQSAARISPIVVALFVTVLSAIIIRRAAEVGMDLARDGLGVVLDPLAPVSMLALYIMALAAVTWTLVSCLAAPAPGRRLVGVGIGFVLLGGYAFEWPLQYVLGFLGLVLISIAARQVSREESGAPVETRRERGAVISEGAWQEFVSELQRRIEAERSSSGKPSLLTVRDATGPGIPARTHIVWSEGNLRIRLSLVRSDGRLQYVDYLAGEEPVEGATPSWTIWQRSPQGRAEHPSPPACPGGATLIGHSDFDKVFRMRDTGGFAKELLPDQAMQERAAELLGGWTAFWFETALRHRRVLGYPGRTDYAPAIERQPRAAAGPLCEVLALLGAMATNTVSGSPASDDDALPV